MKYYSDGETFCQTGDLVIAADTRVHGSSVPVGSIGRVVDARGSDSPYVTVKWYDPDFDGYLPQEGEHYPEIFALVRRPAIDDSSMLQMTYAEFKSYVGHGTISAKEIRKHAVV